MNEWPRAILLDTHAAIWLVEGQLSDEVLAKIVRAGLDGGVYVSPVSAWEVGLLARPRPGGKPAVEFRPDPLGWFAGLMGQPIIKPATLTNSMAINSSCLPGELHGDPADRLLVATAREMNMPLLTRDRRILEYAEAGHVSALPC